MHAIRCLIYSHCVVLYFCDSFAVTVTIDYDFRREKCNAGNGLHPIYVNVNMNDGVVMNNWVDSLSAAWPGIQVSLCINSLL